MRVKNSNRSVRGGNRVRAANGAAKAGLVTVATAMLTAGCIAMPQKVDLENSRRENLRNDMQRLAAENVLLPDAPLTLQQCVEFGLQNNLDLRVSRFSEEVARDNAYADRLGMLPSLTIGAEASKRDRHELHNQLNVDTGQVVAATANTTTREKERLTADLSLTWSVLDFGLSYVRAKQAQLNVKALEFQRMRQGQLLALEITEAYWRAALAEDALDYTRAIEKELVAQKQIIDRSVKSRRIDPITAKDAAKRLVDLQIIIRDLRAEVSGARVELGRLMGLRQNQNFTLSREPIRPLLASLPRPHQLKIAQLEEYAMLHRPELYQGDLDQQVRHGDVRAAMLSLFPDLTFGVGSHYDDNRLLHQNQWNTFGVNFLWDILSVPAKLKRRSAAKNAVDVAQHERMAQTIGVLTQVNLSLLDYAVKIDRFLLLEESYTLANDLLKMVRDSNKAGRVTDLAVTQRSLEDVAAKLRRDRSVVEAIVGYRRLLLSIGLDVHHWDRNLAELKLMDSVAMTSDLTRPAIAAVPARPQRPAAVPRVAPPRLNTPRTAPRMNRSSAEENAKTVTDQAVPPVLQRSNPRAVPAGLTRSNGASATTALQAQPARTGSVLPWAIQTGAFSKMESIEANLQRVNQVIPRLVERAEAVIDSRIKADGSKVYRARFVGFTKAQAEQACAALKQHNMGCWVDTHSRQQVAADLNTGRR